MADGLLALDRTLTGGEGQLPGTREEADRRLDLLAGAGRLDRYVTADRSRARLTAMFRLSRWKGSQDEVTSIEREVQAEFGDLAEVKMTGYLKLMANMESHLLSSQIRSLSGALLGVLFLIALLLGSWRIGLLSAIPNLPPILVTLGLMGWAGIDLDPGTVMIGCILLGLVVDDTVHFFSHLRLLRRAGEAPGPAVRETVRATGHAIGITSLALVGGFSTQLLGSFRPNYHFGLLATVAVLAALLFDLVALPAVLRLTGSANLPSPPPRSVM